MMKRILLGVAVFVLGFGLSPESVVQMSFETETAEALVYDAIRGIPMEHTPWGYSFLVQFFH